MLIVWLVEGSPHYASMSPNQHIAYISDIGAMGLKPLFIAGSAVTAVVFDATFIFERYLRHMGRLAHNTSRVDKGLSICAILASLVGGAGLILLTIFDTLRHHKAHDSLLVVFMYVMVHYKIMFLAEFPGHDSGGYIVAAIFICAEYRRVGKAFHEYGILRASFWIKLGFIIVEIVLVIGKSSNMRRWVYWS